MRVKESIKELREICQLPVYQTDSLYGRIFARKVSIYFTKLLLNTPISGNQTTFLFILIGIVAGAFFTSGNYWHSVIGALVLQLWYIFDCVDGEVARYRKSTSITGRFLDYFSHFIIHPYIFICMSFGVYNLFYDVKVFIFGFSAALSTVLYEVIEPCEYKAILWEYYKRGSSVSAKRPSLEQLTTETGRRFKTFFNIFIYPQIMNVITVAAIIDRFIPDVVIGSVKFNCMHIVLLFYGLTTPFIWIGRTFYIVLKKRVDQKYNILLGR